MIVELAALETAEGVAEETAELEEESEELLSGTALVEEVVVRALLEDEEIEL